MDSVNDLLNSSLKTVKGLTNDVLDVLNSSPLVQTASNKADSLAARWRWHDRSLGYSIRVPVSTEWDTRHYVALADLAHSVMSHIRSSGSNELPPTTVAIVLSQLLVFTTPDGVPLKKVCLSPFCVVDKGEYHRLLTCAFVHMDSTHLISNLAAAVPDCLYLERTQGSMALAADVAVLTVLSHGLYVGYAVIEKALLKDQHNFYSVGAVGFSSVVFALKVVAGRRRSGQSLQVLPGLLLPAQYSWVASLALTTLLVPQASFPAHMCGVLAGLAKAYLLEPAVEKLRALQQGQGQGQGRFYGSSTLSGRPVRRTSRWRWRELLKHLGLAAAAVGIYSLAHKRIGATSNITRWRMQRAAWRTAAMASCSRV